MALLLTAIAAGCGGGTAASTVEVRVGDFTRQANAICVAFDKSIEDLGKPTTLPQLVRYFDGWKPRLQATLVDIRRVPVPSDRSERFYAWVDETSALLAAVEEIRKTAARGDAASVRDQARALDRKTKALDRTARSLGLDDCTG